MAPNAEAPRGGLPPPAFVNEEEALKGQVGTFADELDLHYVGAQADVDRLAELGYQQVYKRQMTPFQQWAYTFSYTAPCGFTTGYYGFMYSYGGPVAIVWGFLATAFGTLCMAFALAEVISAFPALGSVYLWIYKLCGKNPVRNWLSWFVGYWYLIGSFCGTALNEYLLAELIGTMVLLWTGGAQNGGYQLTDNQIVAVTAAVFVLHYFVSITSTRWLGRISVLSAFFQVACLIVICVSLLAMAPKYQTASFAFFHYAKDPTLGVGSTAFLILLGLPYYQSILTGFEIGSHVIEETKRAAVSGANAMVRSVYVTASVEFVYLLVLNFCIQNPDNIIGSNTATGGGSASSASQIFYDVFDARYHAGAVGGVLFTSFAVISLFFGNISNVTLTARMAYAMARDGALPFSGLLVKLTPNNRIPLNGTILTVVISFLATLPSLGSSVAFTAITAMSTITAYIPYTVVIICRHAFKNDFVPGPVTLGRFSLYVGIWGSLWGTIMCILFCLPPTYPVDASSFNYAAPSMFGASVLGALWWVIWGKKSYTGPKRTLEYAESKVEYPESM